MSLSWLLEMTARRLVTAFADHPDRRSSCQSVVIQLREPILVSPLYNQKIAPQHLYGQTHKRLV